MYSAGSPLRREEFITDVIAIIDETAYTDPGGLMRILKSYNPKREGSRYKVKGTFEEVENISKKLTEVKYYSSLPTHGLASTHVRSAEVSAFVMDYIKKKCSQELDKIQGNSFIIQSLSDPRAVHSSTVRVIFRPRQVSMSSAHADFVRQRFITFYQRTASDLKVTSIRFSRHDHKDLERRFPHLVFTPSHNKYEATVSGPFVYVAKLKELLNMQSSRKSPVSKGPSVTPSSRTSVPSPGHSTDPEEEPCPICMEPIAITNKKTLQCKHSFCRDCLKMAFNYKPVCPTCGKLYGSLTGTQPEGGTMRSNVNSSSLPGFENYGTIVIHYYIPSGIQKEEHPNPGQPYEGVSRTAYLPDSLEGRSILKLLKRAFDQRLIFTVGRSTTSGRNNTVTWNDIHHKTSARGGPTHYGYPDPGYLRRVRDELKVKGIE